MKTHLSTIRALVVDMDGVLWRGRAPLPGVAEFFAFLRAQEIAFLLATNNSTREPEFYMERLASLGVSVTAGDILTSSEAVARDLAREFPPGTRILSIGEAGLATALQNAGFLLVEQDARIVVSGLDRKLTFDKLRRATLEIRAGARFVGTNPDKTFPSEEGIIPGAGAILAALEAATGRPPDRVVGKPSAAMFDLAVDLLRRPRGLVAMLGDRLDTDVAGAHAAGLQSILVLTGISTRTELETSPIQPDWVFENLPALLTRWQNEVAANHVQIPLN